MMILGLLLVGCAVGLGVDVVLENTSSIGVDAAGANFSVSPGWLFVTGIATGVIGLAGVGMAVTGIARARRRRAALVESRESLQSLQVERDRLAVELERERAARTTTTATRHDDGPAAQDGGATVIDVSDQRRTETTSTPVAVADRAGSGPAAERQEPVPSGRHGLFHRRDGA